LIKFVEIVEVLSRRLSDVKRVELEKASIEEQLRQAQNNVSILSKTATSADNVQQPLLDMLEVTKANLARAMKALDDAKVREHGLEEDLRTLQRNNERLKGTSEVSLASLSELKRLNQEQSAANEARVLELEDSLQHIEYESTEKLRVSLENLADKQQKALKAQDMNHSKALEDLQQQIITLSSDHQLKSSELMRSESELSRLRVDLESRPPSIADAVTGIDETLKAGEIRYVKLLEEYNGKLAYISRLEEEVAALREVGTTDANNNHAKLNSFIETNEV
jgi:chromosome segregation ATPase